MKNAYSFERLSSTTGDFTNRVKNLFSGSPLNRKKRAMSLNSVLEPASTATFGVPLEELAKREEKDVPLIIRNIVLHVEKKGLKEEGLYRVNGNAKVIERLKNEFDKYGDAQFPVDDVAAVGGLLKLFLRQLPDGVVPDDLMQAFFKVQEAHPRDATPEALNKLHQCLQQLPNVNLTVLSYLVRHLVKVAEHSEENKMTPVSLSIVFGPNIFHCGSGLEALKRQGFSNAIMCRFIQYYEKLFAKRQSKDPPPSKPRPYAEHLAEKSSRQESHDSGSAHDISVGSHDGIEESYSERSIDEAIQEHSAGTLSPTSPTPLLEESGPAVTVQSPPSRPPPPKVSSKSEPLVIKSLDEQQNNADDASPENATPDDNSNFSRRYAKRGMKFKSKNFDKNDVNLSTNEGVVLRRHHCHGNTDVVAGSKVIPTARDGEDVPPMRTPSPYSMQSSPGTSPPTSPTLTPRSSRIVSSVIEDSVKQFLFDSSTAPPPGKTRAEKPSTADSASKPPRSKADVYGLLLPQREGQRSVGKSTDSALNGESSIKTESNRVKLRQPNQSTDTNDTDTNTAPTVVKRRSQNLKKLRNRKSALFGSTEEELGDAPLSPIHDMDVQLVSVSPQNSLDGESNVAALQGKVADLVKEYDKDDAAHEEGGSESQRRESTTPQGGSGLKKKRPNSRAFDMFEKSGMIIGMGSPPPGLIQKKSVSFSSPQSTTPPDITVDGDNNDQPLSSESLIEGGLKSDPSTRRTLTIVSEDLTGATSLSNTDEDVFVSPRPSNSSTPAHKPHPITSHNGGSFKEQRSLLSTTTSDDVFLSPLHSGDGNHGDEVDGGGSAPNLNDFDDVRRTGRKLTHLTLDRPKGPSFHRRRRQHHASYPAAIRPKPHPQTAIQLDGGQDEPDTGMVLETGQTSQTGFKDKQSSRPKSVPEASQAGVEQQQQPVMKTEGQSQASPKERKKQTRNVSSPSRHKRSKPNSSSQSTDNHTTTTNPQPTSNSKSPPKSQKEPRPTDVASTVPSLDLMSLAPEVKQTVKEGWTEPGGSDDGGKAISRRMQELKKTVREFEANFAAKHSHKPSGREKDPIRAQLDEYTQLRKQLKSLRESSTIGEAALSQTAPPEVRLTDDVPVGSEARLTKLSMELSSDQLSPREKRQSAHRNTRSGASNDGAGGGTSSQLKETTVSPLQETLDKILTSLAVRRKTAGRPDNLHEMTADQIQDEKHAIQKALLNFEKAFGRPQSKLDKETMRPLYDRYRSVKRVCSSDSKQKESRSLSMLSTTGLDVTATGDQTLPSITMLQSSTMSQSLPIEHPTTTKTATKTGDGSTVHSRQSESLSSPARKESESKQGAHAELTGSQRHKGSSKETVERVEEAEMSLEGAQMSSEELSTASLRVLKQQHGLLMVRKKEIRKVLKEFENDFQAKHGRSVQKQDRKPKQNEYSDYKNIKARLKMVETLMVKYDPHVTV